MASTHETKVLSLLEMKELNYRSKSNGKSVTLDVKIYTCRGRSWKVLHATVHNN